MSLVADPPSRDAVNTPVGGPSRGSDRVDAAVAAMRRGSPIVLAAAGRSHLVAAGRAASPTVVSTLIREGSGYLIAAAPASHLESLDLPVAAGGRVSRPDDPARYTVSFDAREGIGTGISGRDRARTLTVFADPTSGPGDLTRPGHVVATPTDARGVLGRPSPAEAAVDLAVLAGRGPAAVLCALLDDLRGDPLDPASTDEFARTRGLVVVGVDDLVRHRLRADPPVRRLERTRLATAFGGFVALRYRDERGQREHVALSSGEDPLTALSSGRAAAVALLVTCPFAAVGSPACPCASDRDTALSLMGPGGGLVLSISPCTTPATDDDGDANEVGATTVAVLADLARLGRGADVSPPSAGSDARAAAAPLRIRLLRPAESCHATPEALAGIEDALRDLGVVVDCVVLLGRSTAAAAPTPSPPDPT